MSEARLFYDRDWDDSNRDICFMAKIEDLIGEVSEPRLREELGREIKDIKETKRFGLVFEEHIPETVSLSGLPIRPGLVVQNRTTPDDLTEYEVLSVEEDKATVVPRSSTKPENVVDVSDLLVVKRFHESIYPGLKPVGEVRKGPSDKRAHVLLNGENFHALQLLIYPYAGKVDCIYRSESKRQSRPRPHGSRPPTG